MAGVRGLRDRVTLVEHVSTAPLLKKAVWSPNMQRSVMDVVDAWYSRITEVQQICLAFATNCLSREHDTNVAWILASKSEK